MASEPIYKVFVSSTFEDLREERAEVQKALLKSNCLPVGMELFPAADDDTWDFIKEQIDDSDYYVVLVGGRYGSIALDGLSFTEKEYDYAREREVPVIGFVHADRKIIPYGRTETDPALVKKLDAFITKIKRRPVRTFTNPHQLASEVTTSFVDLKRTRRRTGFVRTDQVVEYKKYAELLERNAELERRLSELKSQDAPFAGHDDPFTIKLGDGSGDIITVKWSDMFIAAASAIIVAPEEWRFTDEFMRKLGRSVNNDRLARARIGDETVTMVREQLFSFNLIDFVDETAMPPMNQSSVQAMLGTYPQRVRFWRLTEYGRRQLALLRRK
jgi:hypothetical protein